MLKALGSGKKALIVTENADQAVVRAAGNIPGVKVAHVGCLNVLDILNCDKFIISQDRREEGRVHLQHARGGGINEEPL